MVGEREQIENNIKKERILFPEALQVPGMMELVILVLGIEILEGPKYWRIRSLLPQTRQKYFPA